MPSTSFLDLPLLAASQAQKHVTHNESLTAIDALMHLSALSRASAPPPAPQEGLRLLISPAPLGAFANRAEQVALFQDGGWRFFAPRAGWRLWLQSEAALLVFDGASWRAVDAQIKQRLGVNATPDDANRLAVAADSASFSAASADIRVKVNKSAVSGAATVLFQTNWSGRAELGLNGADDFSLKVSNGDLWRDAMTIERASAAARFPGGLKHGRVNAPLAGLMFVSGGDGVVSMFRNELTRSAARSAVLSGRSGDVLTLTTPDAALFHHALMENVAYVRLWNMSKSPPQPCWVKASPSPSQLQVFDAASIAGWAAGETIRIGDPYPSVTPTRAFALDISPMLSRTLGSVFRQSGLILKAASAGVSTRVGFQVSGSAQLGSFVGVNALSNGGLNNSVLMASCETLSPISDSNLLYVREDDAGANTLGFSILSCIAVTG